MKSNIEIKAKITDVQGIEKRVQDVCKTDPSILHQKDIYYKSKSGRLKLRIFSDNEGELIYYERENVEGPKKSDYSIYKTSNPTGLGVVLGSSLQILGVVEKRRAVYTKGQTRIHLDEVNNLGRFMELEVVLNADQDSGDGITIAKELMKLFKIKSKDLIEGSYIDLIINEA